MECCYVQRVYGVLPDIIIIIIIKAIVAEKSGIILDQLKLTPRD
jgi:hypothetical protein